MTSRSRDAATASALRRARRRRRERARMRTRLEKLLAAGDWSTPGGEPQRDVSPLSAPAATAPEGPDPYLAP